MVLYFFNVVFSLPPDTVQILIKGWMKNMVAEKVPADH